MKVFKVLFLLVFFSISSWAEESSIFDTQIFNEKVNLFYQFPNQAISFKSDCFKPLNAGSKIRKALFLFGSLEGLLDPKLKNSMDPVIDTSIVAEALNNEGFTICLGPSSVTNWLAVFDDQEIDVLYYIGHGLNGTLSKLLGTEIDLKKPGMHYKKSPNLYTINPQSLGQSGEFPNVRTLFLLSCQTGVLSKEWKNTFPNTTLFLSENNLSASWEVSITPSFVGSILAKVASKNPYGQLLSINIFVPDKFELIKDLLRFSEGKKNERHQSLKQLNMFLR